MRFLTSYYSSILNSSKILTGSSRMKERPILILVEALNNLGADIEYIDKKGYPPIKINGKLIYGDTDSCYIHFPNLKTSEECWDYALKVEEVVSKIFPRPMKLEFEEAIYWKFFILSKKRYFSLLSAPPFFALGPSFDFRSGCFLF